MKNRVAITCFVNDCRLKVSKKLHQNYEPLKTHLREYSQKLILDVANYGI